MCGLYTTGCNNCGWTGAEEELVFIKSGKDFHKGCPECSMEDAALYDGFQKLTGAYAIISATHTGSLGVLFTDLDGTGYVAIDDTITLYETIIARQDIYYHLSKPSWDEV